MRSHWAEIRQVQRQVGVLNRANKSPARCMCIRKLRAVWGKQDGTRFRWKMRLSETFCGCREKKISTSTSPDVWSHSSRSLQTKRNTKRPARRSALCVGDSVTCSVVSRSFAVCPVERCGSSLFNGTRKSKIKSHLVVVRGLAKSSYSSLWLQWY